MSHELLVVNDLTVKFGGLCALDHVTFSVGPGEIIGIIGPNGAGKSTLFNALVGVQRTSEGSVFFDGHKITQVRPHRITRYGMTKTFQNAALFPDMSVFENVVTAALVRHGLKDAERVAERTLSKIGLASISDQEVTTLTFPQKALVELARALATEPKLVLLDEVMAALTQSEMDDVMSVIKSLRKEGLSFLVVEHHMRAIMSLCDRLLVLTFGKLITEGPPLQVIKHPEVIRAYLGTSPANEEAEHA